MIKKKSQLDLAQYRGRDMIQAFRRLFMMIMQYRSTYLEVNERQKYFKIDLKDLIEEFNSYYVVSDIIWSELADRKACEM